MTTEGLELHRGFEYDWNKNRISNHVSVGIESNLASRYPLRDYQHKALCFLSHNDKEERKRHLLFHMATGSGKTLVMAAAMLYFYTRGYRRFLFCSNREVIVAKTQDNLLNPASAKYLFAQEICMDGLPVQLREVTAFTQGADGQDIEIMLATVQKLHGDLKNPKENGLSEEALRDEKMVILADEAHHLQTASKSKGKKDEEAWEYTIKKLLGAHKDNYLLELTATMNLKDENIAKKYTSKLLVNYPLKAYREGGYSKEIYCSSGAKIRLRMLQAILLSQYRRDLLNTQEQTNIKPVILFKSAAIGKTQSHIQDDLSKEEACYYAEKAYSYFLHDFLSNLSADDFGTLRKFWQQPTSDHEKKNVQSIVTQALDYFEKSCGISELIATLQQEFSEKHCRLVHSQKADKSHISMELNNLEQENNPIRAIFAVDMLNEGWDVLNLFDIVRLYETKQKPKITPTQEAQLIGRGARYYPFSLKEQSDTAGNAARYRRKFDNDTSHPLRVCETLYYHCAEDTGSSFIRELNEALIKEGLKEEQSKQVELKLKDEFKDSHFYQKGQIVVNSQQDCRKDIPIALQNEKYSHALGATRGEESQLATEKEKGKPLEKHTYIKGKELGYAVLRTAIQRTQGFTYEYIREKYQNERAPSMRKYMEEILFPLDIRIEGRSQQEKLSQEERLEIADYFIRKVKYVIDHKSQQKKGTPFDQRKPIKQVFRDTTISSSNRAVDCSEENFHAYEKLYLTGVEEDFLSYFRGKIDKLRHKYPEIYLLRNERFFKIYSFKEGKAFQPDFVLFVRKNKERDPIILQCFIEPKGSHMQEDQKWKENFLKEIEEHNKKHLTVEMNGKKVPVFGLPFYNEERQNEFDTYFNELFS